MQSWIWPDVAVKRDEQIEFEIIGAAEADGMLHLVADGFGAETKAGSVSIFANKKDCIYGESTSN